MSSQSTNSCGRVEKWSWSECLAWLANAQVDLTESMEQFLASREFKGLPVFHVRYHYGQILSDNSGCALSAPCRCESRLCISCQAFLSECKGQELLSVVGSKVLELFAKCPFTGSEASGNPRIVPLHLFRSGTAFLGCEVTSGVSHALGRYKGFSFGIAAGARTPLISMPARDVRLARKIRKSLPQRVARQFVGFSDKQLALRLDQDHGLLLRLLSQIKSAFGEEDSWVCDIFVVPIPSSHASNMLQRRVLTAPETVPDILPYQHLRNAAAANILAGLAPRPYADRTALHILAMLQHEVPGFRIADREGALPMNALIRVFGACFKEDFGSVPIIFEPFQHQQGAKHPRDSAIFYSPAAPTVLGPIEQPRSYGQFFEDLEVRLRRLKNAGLLPASKWNFYSSQQFDSPLGTEVLQPTAVNFMDGGLSQFLTQVKRILPHATVDDIITPAKTGFFSRFIRFEI